MSSPTVYFIAGASRGIGLALVKELITNRSNVYVFAGARGTAPTLEKLVADHSDRMSIVRFVSADESSNREAAKIIGDKFGRVDTVMFVAGAGATSYLSVVSRLRIVAIFQVNVIGMIVLFQAFIPLLKKSKNPKFLPFSSAAASITAYTDLQNGYGAYGASKVALNYLARKIHFENKWLTCFPFSPGIIMTELAYKNRAMDKIGTLAHYQDTLGVTPEVGAKMLLDITESATRETHGGEFINLDGLKVPW
ncbi:Norsolorinic acid ketoreductase [Leucoagaricus sp. SymC.cos]|nr:Norsolorinic acid ketoreductase [Leucoagaricus sp. SymC.cos]